MIFATNNNGKINELKRIFGDENIFSLKEKNIKIDVEEDQESFIGNAKKKAIEVYKIAKEAVIADDSGLCINGLNDFPGVNTHRVLGENAADEERNMYLIKETNKCENRDAKVICVLVYYDGKNCIVGEGIIKGKITTSPRGENGFGFDTIFETEDGRTLAELSSDEKNMISARALAAADLKNKMSQSGQ